MQKSPKWAWLSLRFAMLSHVRQWSQSNVISATRFFSWSFCYI